VAAARPPIDEPELRSCYEGRDVLVTGASGFLGAHLLRRLAGLGARCTGLHRPGSSLSRLVGLPSNVRLVASDLQDREGLSRAVVARPPRVVFHLAAYGVDPKQKDLGTAFQSNVIGFVNLVESLRSVPLDAFVNTGTCSEYPGGIDRPLVETDPVEPQGPYAMSKAAAVSLGQMLARTEKRPIVTLRPFTFYGPLERPDRLIPHVISSVVKGQDIRMTGGRQTRDFIYVDDVVEAYLRAAVPPVELGEVFNIGSGTATTVLALVERLRDLAGSMAPMLVGAIPYRENEMWHLCADIRKARQRLGWSPRVSLDDGLKRMLEWHRAAAGR
jgi:nucleoside-diphosphate-sugar epimerase